MKFFKALYAKATGKSAEYRWSQEKARLMANPANHHRFDGTPNPSKAETFGLLLDNARRGSANQSHAERFSIPLIAAMFPKLLANEIVGVQAMSAEASTVRTIRVSFNPESTSNRMSIKVITDPVEAQSSPLAARVSPDRAGSVVVDGRTLDLDKEIISALANEILADHDLRILSELRGCAGNPVTFFDQNAMVAANGAGMLPYIGDVHALLSVLINQQCNHIAARTRRGSGNWTVVSPTALTILQSGTTSAFVKSVRNEGARDVVECSTLAGQLLESVNVYVNPYLSEDVPVLVGYKGSEADAGLIYCPYQLAFATGTIIDPDTYAPAVSFANRDAIFKLPATMQAMGNASDFVAQIGLKNLSFV